MGRIVPRLPLTEVSYEQSEANMIYLAFSMTECTLNFENWLCSLFLYRGDIVIAKSPLDPNMNICKRVIGLEGDKVCSKGPSDLFKTHTYVSMFTF